MQKAAPSYPVLLDALIGPISNMDQHGLWNQCPNRMAKPPQFYFAPSQRMEYPTEGHDNDYFLCWLKEFTDVDADERVMKSLADPGQGVADGWRE